MAKKKKAGTGNGFESVNTRRAHDVPGLSERLAALLTAEKGVRVARADALHIAVQEALTRRERQPAPKH